MKSEELARLSHFERFYWWHVGRKSIVRTLLKKYLPHDVSSRIVNIGCGTGGTEDVLTPFGKVIHADVSRTALEFAREHVSSPLVQIGDGGLPVAPDSVDVIVALDVLEHIRDDYAALREWRSALKPNGILFLTVPAYQWLWSSHDESLGHYRRYGAAGLHALLNRAQFRVLRRTYIITFPFPIIVLFRLITSLLPSSSRKSSYVILPAPVNSFFIWLLRLEAFLVKYLSFPFGTSVAIIATKKDRVAESDTSRE